MDLDRLLARSLKREMACMCVCACVRTGSAVRRKHCAVCGQEEAKDKGCGHWCVNPGFTIDQVCDFGQDLLSSPRLMFLLAIKWA